MSATRQESFSSPLTRPPTRCGGVAPFFLGLITPAHNRKAVKRHGRRGLDGCAWSSGRRRPYRQCRRGSACGHRPPPRRTHTRTHHSFVPDMGLKDFAHTRSRPPSQSGEAKGCTGRWRAKTRWQAPMCVRGRATCAAKRARCKRTRERTMARASCFEESLPDRPPQERERVTTATLQSIVRQPCQPIARVPSAPHAVVVAAGPARLGAAVCRALSPSRRLILPFRAIRDLDAQGGHALRAVDGQRLGLF